MVYHVLKDGSRTTNITGYIVKLEDAKPIYGLMDAINYSGSRKEKRNENANKVS